MALRYNTKCCWNLPYEIWRFGTIAGTQHIGKIRLHWLMESVFESFWETQGTQMVDGILERWECHLCIIIWIQQRLSQIRDANLVCFGGKSHNNRGRHWWKHSRKLWMATCIWHLSSFLDLVSFTILISWLQLYKAFRHIKPQHDLHSHLYPGDDNPIFSFLFYVAWVSPYQYQLCIGKGYI